MVQLLCKREGIVGEWQRPLPGAAPGEAVGEQHSTEGLAGTPPDLLGELYRSLGREHVGRQVAPRERCRGGVVRGAAQGEERFSGCDTTTVSVGSEDRE